MPVEENQGAQSLGLGGGRHLAVDGQVARLQLNRLVSKIYSEPSISYQLFSNVAFIPVRYDILNEIISSGSLY
jgi:hypothetical protein